MKKDRNSIRKHLIDYLTNRLELNEYELEDCKLHHFMDSLDIVEMVFEIERVYFVDLYDKWLEWEDRTLDEVIDCIYLSLNKN